MFPFWIDLEITTLTTLFTSTAIALTWFIGMVTGTRISG